MKHVLINNDKYRIDTSTHFNGVIVSMSDEEFEKMRVRGPQYLATPDFSPDSISYIHYDQVEDMCELDEETCTGKVGRVLLATARYLPPSTTLFAFRPKRRKYQVELAAAEFKIEGDRFMREVTPSPIVESYEQDGLDSTTDGVRLSEGAAKYLEGLPMGAIERAGESQREIAGELKLTKGNVLEIMMPGNLGKLKSVKLNKSAPYTYHSHPDDAYRASGVGMGFPSPKDYTIFFVNKTMKLHFVASREGLYVMARGQEEITDVNATEFRNLLDDSSIASKTNGMSGSEHAKAITDLGFFRVSFVEWRNKNKFIIYI